MILLALAASWISPASGQPAPSPDWPPIPYRRDSPGRPRTLAGPNLQAGAVAFSPDASTLFIGYEDGSIRRHDTKTGRQLGPTIQCGSASIHAIAVSPDGQMLAVAVPALNFFPPCDLITLRRPDGSEISEFSRTPGRVIALAYASDGKTIGAIDLFINVRVWRVENRSEVLISEIHRSNGRRPDVAETRANFSADLKRAVIVNDDDDVTFNDAPWNHLIWLWEAGRKEPRLFGGRVGSGICSATLSPDGSQIAIAQELHHVFYHDFDSGRFLRQHYPASVKRGEELSFLMRSPDNRRLISATKRGYVVVNDLDDKLNGRHGFPGPYGHIRAAAFVPGGVRFASGGWDPLGADKIPGTDWPKYEPVLLWEVKVEGM